MRRGDIVSVVLARAYGKPRPAVVVQSDVVSGIDSVIVCPLTTARQPSIFYRIDVEPTKANALSLPSQIMADKLQAIPRTKIGGRIGRLESDTMTQLSDMLAVVIGLID